MSEIGGDIAWVKSRFCNGSSGCVEVARLPDGGMALRDSKRGDGPVIVFTAGEWESFAAGVRAGEFE